MEAALEDVLARGEMERRELTLGPLGTVVVELERLYWESLEVMCGREGTTVDAVAESLAESVESPDLRYLDRALRIAVLSYFRDASALACDSHLPDVAPQVPVKRSHLRLLPETSAC